MNKETHTLQLKDIAPYFPYGLKGVTDFLPNTVFIVDNISANRIKGLTEQGNNVPLGCTFKEFKPLLRNLSDLTKEIEVNGEKFVPIDWLEGEYYTLDLHKQCERLVEEPMWVNQCDYMLIIHLVEWHFDVFDLHSKNLCIYYDELK